MNQIVVESTKTSYSQVTKAIAGGVGAILIFDTLASLASLAFSIDYSSFAIGSAIIYFLVGYFASKRSRSVNSLLGVSAVAFADITLGWAISWSIGPGRVDEGISVALLIAATISVLLFAWFFGALGGLLSRWI